MNELFASRYPHCFLPSVASVSNTWTIKYGVSWYRCASACTFCLQTQRLHRHWPDAVLTLHGGAHNGACSISYFVVDSRRRRVHVILCCCLQRQSAMYRHHVYIVSALISQFCLDEHQTDSDSAMYTRTYSMRVCITAWCVLYYLPLWKSPHTTLISPLHVYHASYLPIEKTMDCSSSTTQCLR